MAVPSLTILMILPAITLAGENWSDWDITRNKAGIKVEARKNKDTGVLQTRTTAVLNCSTDALWDLLITERTFLELFPDMRVSKKLKDNAFEFFQNLQQACEEVD